MSSANADFWENFCVLSAGVCKHFTGESKVLSGDWGREMANNCAEL